MLELLLDLSRWFLLACVLLGVFVLWLSFISSGFAMACELVFGFFVWFFRSRVGGDSSRFRDYE